MTTLRLSDAIALGRTLMKPWGSTGGGYQIGEGCALMMAAQALDGGLLRVERAFREWPGMNHKTVIPLPCDCGEDDLVGPGLARYTRQQLQAQSWRGPVIHMFNHHVYTTRDWTLDQMVDWIRSEEARLIPTVPESDVEMSMSLPIPVSVGSSL